MPRLNLANNAGAFLVNDITDIATSFDVTEGSIFPSAPFRCTIYKQYPENGEIIEVGVKSGNTFSSIQRGLEGTSAQAWDSGDKIELLGTAGTYEELVSTDDIRLASYAGAFSSVNDLPDTADEGDFADVKTEGGTLRYFFNNGAWVLNDTPYFVDGQDSGKMIHFDDGIHDSYTNDFKLYGTTFVNLLGNYGDFENDSNSDGLADGWSASIYDTTSLDTDAVFGSKAQYVKYTHQSDDSTQETTTLQNLNVSALPEHKYMLSEHIKKTSSHNAGYTEVQINWFDSLDNNLGKKENIITNDLETSYKRFNTFFTTAADTSYLRLYLFRSTTGADSTEVVELYVDGAMIIDLTEMGALDPARQAKYGVTNWEDLTEEQLEAEIQYFDTISAPNYDSEGNKVLTIENKGKNLIDLNSDFPAKWGDTDYSWVDNGIWRDGGVECSDSNGYRIWSLPLWLKGGTTYTLSLYGEKLQPSVADNLFYFLALYKFYIKDATGTAKPSGIEIGIIGQESNEGNLSYQFTPSETGWYSIFFDFFRSHGFIKNLQIEEGSEATEYQLPLNEMIEIPEGKPLLHVGDTHSYIDLRNRTINKKVEAEEVTLSSNSATLSKSGTGTAILIDSDGLPYTGTADGTTLTTSGLSDGTYKVIYKLTNPEYYDAGIYYNSVYAQPHGGVNFHNDRINDVSRYGYRIDVSDTDKPIVKMLQCNKINNETGNLDPVDLTDITIADDGLSFEVSGASEGEWYDFTYIYSNNNFCSTGIEYKVAGNISGAIVNNTQEVNNVKREIEDTRQSIESVNHIVSESGVLSQTENYSNGYDNFKFNGFQQSPSMNLYGTTFMNMLGNVAYNTANFDFSTIKRCNVADDGTVNAYFGDAGYVEDGSNGQVMVEIPQVYYKIEFYNDVMFMDIASSALDGYSLHPAFIRDGVEKDYIYVGAFQASFYDTSGSTYANYYEVEHSTDITGSGTSWQLDLGTNGDGKIEERKVTITADGEELHDVYVSDTQGDLENTSDVKKGEVNYETGAVTFTSSKTTVTADYYINNADGSPTGTTPDTTADTGDVLASVAGRYPLTKLDITDFRTLAHNRGSGWEQIDFLTQRLVNLLFIIEYGSLDGQSALGQGVVGKTWNSTYKAELTGQATYGSDNPNYGITTDGLHSMCYRGIENWWGNVWQWCDGINIKADWNPWIADHGFESDKFESPYWDTGLTLPNDVGYISDIYTSPDWAFLHKAKSGSSSTYFCDYYYANTGNRALRFGGHWFNGGLAGPWSWYGDGLSSFTDVTIGGRLIYIP